MSHFFSLPRSFAPLPSRCAALLGLLVFALVLGASPARAAPPPLDLDELPRADALDLAPHELWLAPSAKSPAWIAIDASLRRRDDQTAFGAMLLFGLPLERIRGAPPRIAEQKQAEPPAEAPRIPADKAAEAPPASLPSFRPGDVRETVARALAHAHLSDAGARVDAIAARARLSALLPELRFRVSRSVDESQTLSPTEYDPMRTTSSGGHTLWLEARATFRLDRLIFADEEIALERARRERVAARAQLTTRVLKLLFAWRRAITLQRDPAISPDDQLAAALAEAEAEAELDVLTGGWFSLERGKTSEGS